MFLDLTGIRQPETAVERRFEADAFAPEEDFRIVAPALLTGTLHKDEDRFRLEGRVSTRIEALCSRCAEPVEMAVDNAFELRLLPQTLAGDRTEDPDNDPTTAFYADDRLDLGQIVREQCYLTLPMKPLCTPECKGLCPQCGTNLNTERCDCAPSWQDPRLAVLQSLASSRTDDDA
ncbi:MAG: DUF177 domain-containing protein [Vicinamibacterales bacterium]